MVLHTVESVVRGGGLGNRLWVARITGECPEWGFARSFVRADRSGLSGSGRSGVLVVEITEPGVYQVRGQMTHSRSIADRECPDYFIAVAGDGTVEEIGRDEVLARVAEVSRV